MKSIKHSPVFFLALMLASIAGCATTDTASDTMADRSRTTTGQYVDDSTITTKVKAAIFNEPGLESADINVETNQGNVQLSGFVESRDDITRAVEVAQRVDGVRSVKNDMRLKEKGYR
ncbi:BON domain-containing protein [Methylobacter sp. YRD-M1]|uniref:BON domain-containing protein n=1 Tax=Methylobacter sp. YRD-M1 TaxID=2911520 RepID=UPI00227CF2A9|nr:BON domain-containing protein [Methylobacter sp. YRD-M1]WAK03906.1 BON domain-containing protein [Methylobacter sp. YRD-M1]